MLGRIGLVIALSLALPGSVLAEKPPPCGDDPTRTIFAGVDNGPCKEFHGDQATCEAAYYMNRGGEVVSCAYIAGTCIGCGGDNLACPTNTCNGRANGLSPATCEGDPGRTAFLGKGDNGSHRCRNLDHTSQTTCENAFYDDAGDNRPVACAWFPGDGSCRGCGDDGNHCAVNVCAPEDATLPDVKCTEDPTRTNLLGFGGNEQEPCRRLGNTDKDTCENAFYAFRQTGLPVACWWDGDDCRGSGFDSERGFTSRNACLSSVAPPPGVGECAGDPRETSLGFGGNGNESCRVFDHTDEATCEGAFYLDSGGAGIACWWDGAHCRGSRGAHFRENVCRGTVIAATAVCADGRTNLLGFGAVGGDGAGVCRSFSGTDPETCENAYYESARTGIAVACAWDQGECRGCSGRSACESNPCVVPECAIENGPETFLGFGGNGRFGGGGDETCLQIGNEEDCVDSFYFSTLSGRAVGCWWHEVAGECKGSTRAHLEEDPCRDPTPAQCTMNMDRDMYLGFGANDSQVCRQLNGMQGPCESAYYETLSGKPVACWWQDGVCSGSNRRNLLLNDCVRTPETADATCADESRTVLIGFGGTRIGNDGGACKALGDSESCNMAYYQSLRTGVAVACVWDGFNCNGTSTRLGENSCLDLSTTCPLDDTRNEFLGTGSNNDENCRGLDQGECQDSYYLSIRTGGPSACWWDGSECHGTSRRFFPFNECAVDSAPQIADVSCNAEGRTVLLGFGNFQRNGHGAHPCANLGDQGACEIAFYQSFSNGQAVSCWWDGSEDECRGSGRSYSEENVCEPDGVCPRDPDRETVLGFGNNNSAPCRGIEGMGKDFCEGAFYLGDSDLEPVACWWDEESSECRGSKDSFERLNACVRTPRPPTATCGLRTTLLGIGENGSGRGDAGYACRQLDGAQEACEDAFYESDDDYAAVACIWAAGADLCLGTGHVPALNACADPVTPVCEGNEERDLFIGRGQGQFRFPDGGIGENGGACRQFDDQREACDSAFYLNNDGQPVACWWDDEGDGFGDCLGTNRPDEGRFNDCQPTAPCDEERSISLGFRSGRTCRDLSSVGAEACEDAYYIHPTGDFAVGCYWTGFNCVGCGGNFYDNSSCPSNPCSSTTPTCAGDTERTELHRCQDAFSQEDCEGSFHVTGRSFEDGIPHFVASCAWDEVFNRCFGCGVPSQSSRECANACVVGCGNGVVDDGEQCDDGNMFNGDCCDENCQLETNGSPCTDRLFCTEGAGACQDGECVGAPARICASCIANDCFESINECAEDVREGPPAATGGAAQLQGMSLPPVMPEPEGTLCDDGLDSTAASACDANGMCVEAEGDPTPTPTATPTSTPAPAPNVEPAPVPAMGGWGYAIALLAFLGLAFAALHRSGVRD